MLENTGRALTAQTPPSRPVEFYVVELSQHEDGIGVSLQATTFDEIELQLLTQELGSSRVATIDDALAFVRQSVAFN